MPMVVVRSGRLCLLLLAAACTRSNPAYHGEAAPPAQDADDAAVAINVPAPDAAIQSEAPAALLPPDAALPADLPPPPTAVTLTEPATSPAVKPANPGGSGFGDNCGPGRVLTGLIGSSMEQDLMGVNSIQARCADLVLAPGPALGTGAATTLGAHGTVGPVRHQGVCPSDQMVVGFEAATGQWVDRLYVFCAPLTVRQSAAGYEVMVQPGTRLEIPIGPPSDYGFSFSPCPAGKIAVGIEGNSGLAVDWLALRCARPGLR